MDSAAAVCCVVVYSIVFFACLDEKGQEQRIPQMGDPVAASVYAAE